MTLETCTHHISYIASPHACRLSSSSCYRCANAASDDKRNGTTLDEHDDQATENDVRPPKERKGM